MQKNPLPPLQGGVDSFAIYGKDQKCPLYTGIVFHIDYFPSLFYKILYGPLRIYKRAKGYPVLFQCRQGFALFLRRKYKIGTIPGKLNNIPINQENSFVPAGFVIICRQVSILEFHSRFLHSRSMDYLIKIPDRGFLKCCS